ncbi:hypothetical protein EC9_44310 [Rosistilla ulvae]|uniref:Uncharacterized protein n=1 Tax=Rosistilla ulvae TaxID=1930277 RepID=A0A517M5S5_9BACT|nr:hypothetical protein EC9_44310 [Rosistilla ulvae]
MIRESHRNDYSWKPPRGHAILRDISTPTPQVGCLTDASRSRVVGANDASSLPNRCDLVHGRSHSPPRSLNAPSAPIVHRPRRRPRAHPGILAIFINQKSGPLDGTLQPNDTLRSDVRSRPIGEARDRIEVGISAGWGTELATIVAATAELGRSGSPGRKLAYGPMPYPSRGAQCGGSSRTGSRRVDSESHFVHRGEMEER